jgi:hypothetical protein
VNTSLRNLLLFVAAVLPFVASLLYFVLLAGTPLAQLIYSGTKIFTLIWPIAFYRLLVKEAPPRFPLSHNLKNSLFWGVGSGLALVAVLLLLLATPLGDVIHASAPQVRAKAESLGILDYYIPFALFLALLHSLLEEYYWRWFLFGELRRTLGERPLTHGLAALAFAAHHIVVTTQFFPFTYGLVFGLAVGVGGGLWSMLYSKQGSLLSAWISHAIVDLGILAVGYTLLFP